MGLLLHRTHTRLSHLWLASHSLSNALAPHILLISCFSTLAHVSANVNRPGNVLSGSPPVRVHHTPHCLRVPPQVLDHQGPQLTRLFNGSHMRPFARVIFTFMARRGATGSRRLLKVAWYDWQQQLRRSGPSALACHHEGKTGVGHDMIHLLCLDPSFHSMQLALYPHSLVVSTVVGFDPVSRTSENSILFIPSEVILTEQIKQSTSRITMCLLLCCSSRELFLRRCCRSNSSRWIS
jgi:hypothetical protein